MLKRFIVSDIFGRCTGLQQLVQDLNAPKCTIRVLDPYQGQMQSFQNEQQAYAAYCEHFVLPPAFIQKPFLIFKQIGQNKLCELVTSLLALFS